MSAEIIAFPVKQPKFPANWPHLLRGEPVNPPETATEYLTLCKNYLEPEDYTDILVGIMDRDAYDALERPIQKIVDNYYILLN